MLIDTIELLKEEPQTNTQMFPFSQNLSSAPAPAEKRKKTPLTNRSNDL